MFSLAFDVTRWAFRRFIWFLVIVAILWAGFTIRAQLKGLADLETTVQYLNSGKSKLEGEVTVLARTAEQSVARFKAATIAQLDQRIVETTRGIESKKQKLVELDGILTKLNPATQIDVARLKIEIDLATQELEHLRYLREIQDKSSKVGQLAKYCEIIRLRHVAEWNAYLSANANLTKFAASIDWPSRWNPLSDGFLRLEALKAERNQRALNTRELKSQHDQCLANLASANRVLGGLGKAKDFVVRNNRTQAALADLQSQIQPMQDEVDKHWLKPILFDPLLQIVPMALGILAGAILVPVGIKLVLYFVLAPLAAKQAPICPQPDPSGTSSVGQPASKSAVSLSVDVAPDSELVVLPAYFAIAPDRCSTTPRWVLNNRFVLTSLAAGMYNLTEVRAEQAFTATVSIGQELFGELLPFEINEGESVCLRPSSLVGIIQKRNAPARVSSHWRLGSLQAWLTMQLRYLVFHGPATIILKGCRGVRVESAVETKAIEQTATLGFSASLNYTTSRTETFMAYFGGHKGLLRDRFSGRSGYFIYEEMSDPSRKAGLSGKGLEGVFDTVLKLFGI